MGAAGSRLQHLRAILGPFWHYFFVLPFAAISAFTWWRDEWLSPETAAALKIPSLLTDFLPNWLSAAQWYWWVISTFVVLIVLLFENSFRERRKFLINYSAAEDTKNKPTADMAIQDVFFHIDADILEHGRGNEVGQTLLDCLSTGQLKAYGRVANFGNDTYVGFPNLVAIDADYWKTAQFTYEFFGEDREQDIHVEPRKPTRGYSYRDVRFDSVAINQRWKKSDSSDQIFAMKAIYNVLVQSEWAYKLAISPDSMKALPYESEMTRKEVIRRRLVATLKRDLHDHLRAGHIETWVRPDRRHPLSTLPKEEWSKVQIAMDESYLGTLNSGFTIAIPSARSQSEKIIHEGVMFRRSDVYKVYPLRKEAFLVGD